MQVCKANNKQLQCAYQPSTTTRHVHADRQTISRPLSNEETGKAAPPRALGANDDGAAHIAATQTAQSKRVLQSPHDGSASYTPAAGQISGPYTGKLYWVTSAPRSPSAARRQHQHAGSQTISGTISNEVGLGCAPERALQALHNGSASHTPAAKTSAGCTATKRPGRQLQRALQAPHDGSATHTPAAKTSAGRTATKRLLQRALQAPHDGSATHTPAAKTPAGRSATR
ncbi:hypothetical protein PR001_g28707 [Phytophthora rubi]|uniref:Uncharacterized protein n=1 Tax=Phytophthora rubi TaxID=129364 RepID=A0A6A3H745_9STRA|nr:hypothetical protein PR002_g28733 [Phytophthora rubi]KAE8965516.1 hypothetical protein PR001_g28707 [Phytophthora rubi]